MIKELTCINCPLGCALSIEISENNEIVNITGNTCKRGEIYAKKELTSPTRIVTSIVPILNSKNRAKTVSCKTESDIPKDKIFEIMDELKSVTATAPIKIGDVIYENIANTGVNIVATCNIE